MRLAYAPVGVSRTSCAIASGEVASKRAARTARSTPSYLSANSSWALRVSSGRRSGLSRSHSSVDCAPWRAAIAASLGGRGTLRLYLAISAAYPAGQPGSGSGLPLKLWIGWVSPISTGFTTSPILSRMWYFSPIMAPVGRHGGRKSLQNAHSSSIVFTNYHTHTNLFTQLDLGNCYLRDLPVLELEKESRRL